MIIIKKILALLILVFTVSLYASEEHHMLLKRRAVSEQDEAATNKKLRLALPPLKTQEELYREYQEELARRYARYATNQLQFTLAQFMRRNLLAQNHRRTGDVILKGYNNSVNMHVLLELLEQRFPYLSRLMLEDIFISNNGLELLSRSKCASRLHTLTLINNCINLTGFSPKVLDRFTQLRELVVRYNLIGNGVFLSLAASKLASQLEKLDIDWCSATATPFYHSFTSSLINQFTCLKHLNLGFVPIGDVGFRQLALSSLAERLESLSFCSVTITNKSFFVGLLNRFKKLRSLHVELILLYKQGFIALTKSRLASQLESLTVKNCRIPAGAFKKYFLNKFTALKKLEISHNLIGQTLFNELIKSSLIETLEEVPDCAETGLTIRELIALKDFFKTRSLITKR